MKNGRTEGRTEGRITENKHVFSPRKEGEPAKDSYAWNPLLQEKEGRKEGENTVHRKVGHQNWKEARMEGWNEGRKEGRVIPVEHEASPIEE